MVRMSVCTCTCHYASDEDNGEYSVCIDICWCFSHGRESAFARAASAETMQRQCSRRTEKRDADGNVRKWSREHLYACLFCYSVRWIWLRALMCSLPEENNYGFRHIRPFCFSLIPIWCLSRTVCLTQTKKQRLRISYYHCVCLMRSVRLYGWINVPFVVCPAISEPSCSKSLMQTAVDPLSPPVSLILSILNRLYIYVRVSLHQDSHGNVSVSILQQSLSQSSVLCIGLRALMCSQLGKSHVGLRHLRCSLLQSYSHVVHVTHLLFDED